MNSKPLLAKNNAGVWCSRVGGHRADNGHLVRHLSDVRKHVRQPEPTLTALLERKVAAPQQADLSEENVRLLAGAKRLAVGLVQPGFVVVRVDMARTADEADVDRPLGPGREFQERRLAKRRRLVVVSRASRLANAMAPMPWMPQLKNSRRFNVPKSFIS